MHTRAPRRKFKIDIHCKSSAVNVILSRDIIAIRTNKKCMIYTRKYKTVAIHRTPTIPSLAVNILFCKPLSNSRLVK